jgi:adenylate cyclase class 2
MQPREIEVKYRVLDPAVLDGALRAHGCELSEPTHQDDQAYAENGWAYGMSKFNVAFARLRTQNGQHLFTVKRPTLNEMACIEFETQVADREQMHEAILQMGFYATVRIVKSRRTGWLADACICVDDVERLGVFLELEKVVGSHGRADRVQDKLDALARSVNVRLERVTDTYDSLVRHGLDAV